MQTLLNFPVCNTRTIYGRIYYLHGMTSISMPPKQLQQVLEPIFSLAHAYYTVLVRFATILLGALFLPVETTSGFLQFLPTVAPEGTTQSIDMAYKGGGGKIQKVMVQPIVSFSQI